MRVLRRASYRSMPWKNGQGLTEEVLTFPEGSTVDAFDWRISIAHVGADGPFSLFPGIDRTIALLDGNGLILDLPDSTEQLLAPHGDPFAFPGEWEISSRNVDGGTMDLNIMTRRGRVTHTVERVVLRLQSDTTADALTVLFFNDAAHLQSGGEPVSLERFDGVVLSPGETVTVLTAPADAFRARLLHRGV